MILGNIITDEEMKELYLNRDLSAQKIAVRLGCSKSSVCRRLKAMGITKPAKGHKGRNGKRGTVLVNGYPAIYMPEHPRAKSNGYVREHIVVMEAILGRSLNAEEVVHHINEDKTDNSPDNLMLFANNSEHMHYHWKMRHGIVSV